MTDNFRFCNEDFLPLFAYKPYSFYNQFGIEGFTRELVDSMGEAPSYRIEFRYDAAKRIRATFIIFDEVSESCDVKCICTLFHGDRMEHYCYFFELFCEGDSRQINCVEVAQPFGDDRIHRYLDVGEDIDACFEKLCLLHGEPRYDAFTILFYKEADDAFRVLDMMEDDLEIRSEILLGDKPTVEHRIIGGVPFILWHSSDNSSFLAAREGEGGTPTDAKLSDIELLKNI